MKNYVQKAFVILLIALIVTGCSSNASSNPEINIHSDIPYAYILSVDPNLLKLDVYAPSGAKNLPVILMIHGGAWSIGDKANPDAGINKAKYFTTQGYLYVSINYRLSPDVTHPTHVQDVAAAVSWTLENIADYGGDPHQLYLMGHSAGAHLAALVATDERYLAAVGHPLAELTGIILLDGTGYDVPLSLGGQFFLPDRLLQMYADAFGQDPAVWMDASPVTHVASGKGIPPFLILYTGRVAAEVEAVELTTLLSSAGVPAWAYQELTANHASINGDIGTSDDMVTAQIRLFLENQEPYQR